MIATQIYSTSFGSNLLLFFFNFCFSDLENCLLGVPNDITRSVLCQKNNNKQLFFEIVNNWNKKTALKTQECDKTECKQKLEPVTYFEEEKQKQE